MTVENSEQSGRRETPIKISDSLVLLLPRFLSEFLAAKGICRDREEIIQEEIKRTKAEYFQAREAFNEAVLSGHKVGEEVMINLMNAEQNYIDARTRYS